MGSKGPELFEKYYRELFGYRTEDSSPVTDAAFVNIPTFVTQVKDDSATHPLDIQAIYDNIPVKDKKLFWIEGTTQRFRGYTYYSENTSPMIEWYNQY